jgi:GST-like protein
MATYRIFSALGSGGVPVEAAMSLIGLPYEVIEAPTWKGEAEQAKVAVVNPLKQIPAWSPPRARRSPRAPPS